MKTEDRRHHESARPVEAVTRENFGTICDTAVSSLLEGDISNFTDTFQRLETLKVGTVRSLLS